MWDMTKPTQYADDLNVHAEYTESGKIAKETACDKDGRKVRETVYDYGQVEFILVYDAVCSIKYDGHGNALNREDYHDYD